MFKRLILIALLLPIMAQAGTDLPKNTPEQPGWYQQLQTPGALVKANVFKVTDPKPTGNSNYTVMSLKTRPFTTVLIQGNYQVEIIGNAPNSSVEISGDQPDVLNTQISTDNDTRSLSLSEKEPLLNTVTVKITTPVIETLTNNGNGNINAENLNGTAMVITNHGNGKLFISGQGNYAHINLTGNGNIEISKGLADAASVALSGNGNLIMQGNYAIKKLMSAGNGNIRIDGLNSRGLELSSQGNGNITLSGFANLEKLSHTGNGNVLFYWVNSDKASIQASGNGLIGLAGQAKYMNAVIDDHVVFDSRYLLANNLDIRTQGNALAKVIAKQQLTAAATDQSQIIYYNKPTSVLKYNSDNGTILSFP
jgi:hypothetical protein